MTQALAAVPNVSPLLIKPSHYKESLKLDKSVEIIGEGNLGKVVVFGFDASCLVMATQVARVANVLFEYKGAGAAIEIPQGKLILENCWIELQSNDVTGIKIAGSRTSPLVNGCQIEGGDAGIRIAEGATAKIEKGTVTASGSGIVVRGQGTAPVVRDCQAKKNKEDGIRVEEGAQG